MKPLKWGGGGGGGGGRKKEGGVEKREHPTEILKKN